MKIVTCANCGEKIPEHEAWTINGEYACGVECLEKIKQEEEKDERRT